VRSAEREDKSRNKLVKNHAMDNQDFELAICY